MHAGSSQALLPRRDRIPTRLASPIEELKDHYEFVVVGSGYGGAIAASRLARAGRQVCLLERGRELQPGDYPDTLGGVLRETQIDLPRRHLFSRTALYDFRINDQINVFVGCGLGGTSLINANVVLWPEDWVFDDAAWPHGLKEDRAGLLKGRQRALEMLGCVPYAPPPHFPPLAKSEALRLSADRLIPAHPGARWEPPCIAVSFADGTNHVGVQQRACQLCGDCVSGCNYRAKNTLLMNYLPDAWAHGAEIFTEVSVRWIEQAGPRWRVYYELLEAGRERFQAPPMSLTAELVILAAGTLGSTEILLRSKAKGLPLSCRVGQGFIANGDLVGIGYNCDVPVNAVGFGRRHPEGREPVGPTITGMIDLRRQPKPEEGTVVQEGAIPGAISGVMPALLGLVAFLTGKILSPGRRRSFRECLRRLLRMLRGAYSGALRNTQVFLVMTHDAAAGQMKLGNDGRLRVVWPRARQQAFIERANDLLGRATVPLGGTYFKNYLGLYTVHPLGGCRMADDASSGVVNHEGQVFSGESGKDTHKTLYICDGSIVPRPLGVNPLLTISALVERICARLIQQHSWPLNYRLPLDPIPPPTARSRVIGLHFTERRPPGVQFTERMRGSFSWVAYDRETPLECVLTIVADDLERLLNDWQHRAGLVGTVRLSGETMTVTMGEFNFFSVDPERIESRKLRYWMRLWADSGRLYYVEGVKEVRLSWPWKAWADLTTLKITIYDGTQGKPGSVLGQGILRLSLGDLLRQFLTIRARHARALPERLDTLGRFLGFFAGRVLRTYGRALAPTSVSTPDAPPGLRRARPQGREFVVPTRDGSRVLLTRYKGGEKGSVILVPGFGVHASSFATDTVEKNLVEYLCERCYDVWLFDYRASPDFFPAGPYFTLDDIARNDYPAAVDHVLAVTGKEDVQILAHCVGSMSLLMSLLAGELRWPNGSPKVRSAICSQLATHPETVWFSELKAGLYLARLLRWLGVPTVTVDYNPRDWRHRMGDRLLKLLPTRERCNNPHCRRILFVFGESYRHHLINVATHDAIHEWFGTTSLRAMAHISRIVRRNFIVDRDGNDVYLGNPEGLRRLALPISFMHGAENREFVPRATKITYNMLRRANGAHLYRRRVFRGYGHMDCFIGRSAYRDVFWWIAKQLDRFNRDGCGSGLR